MKYSVCLIFKKFICSYGIQMKNFYGYKLEGAAKQSEKM